MVIWTNTAKSDLRAIYDFIAQGSAIYAKKISQDIVEKTHSLTILPLSGRKVAELDEPNIREISAHTYRVIYETRGSDCYVLSVIHKRRELHEKLLER